MGRDESQGAAGTTSGEVSARELGELMRRIRGYARPYREALPRVELGSHFLEMVVGLTSDLERKSAEPITVMHGVPRGVLHRFVGGSRWSCDPLMELLRREVRQEIGVDGSSLTRAGSRPPPD